METRDSLLCLQESAIGPSQPLEHHNNSCKSTSYDDPYNAVLPFFLLTSTLLVPSILFSTLCMNTHNLLKDNKFLSFPVF
jgi:hypothetical protein